MSRKFLLIIIFLLLLIPGIAQDNEVDFGTESFAISYNLTSQFSYYRPRIEMSGENKLTDIFRISYAAGFINHRFSLYNHSGTTVSRPFRNLNGFLVGIEPRWYKYNDRDFISISVSYQQMLGYRIDDVARYNSSYFEEIEYQRTEKTGSLLVNCGFEMKRVGNFFFGCFFWIGS